MLIATSSLGARGLSCGPCSGTTVDVIPLLPPNDGADAGVDAGGYIADACARLCADATSCTLTTIQTGDESFPAIECTTRHDCGGAGRRPPGLEAHARARGDAVGAWLAEMAFLEAASIDAFKILRRDLEAHRAPRRLLGAASRAARDERRHARRMRALARRRGSLAETPIVRETKLPSLEELATQNAIEGCVRETFGALVARWQAGAARDREIGAALARIAEEEAQHAALSWQIDAWARRRLSRAARARVDSARRSAVEELFASLARPVPGALIRDAGHPDRDVARALAKGLVDALGVAPSA